MSIAVAKKTSIDKRLFVQFIIIIIIIIIINAQIKVTLSQ